MNLNTFDSDLWVDVATETPELEDASVLVEFPNGSVDMVHIEDYFKPITNGFDEYGNQLYTCWYITQGITRWHPMPKRARK